MNVFTRVPDGRLQFVCVAGNAEVLQLLMTELATFLRAPDADRRATDRLFPRAYLDPTEDDAEAEWQGIVHDDLARGKIAAFEEVARHLEHATADADGLVRLELTPEEEARFLLAINDARLTLAALAGEEPEPSVLADWLGGLVAELTELQLSELPDVPDDEIDDPPRAPWE
jgi:hypothetical protein